MDNEFWTILASIGQAVGAIGTCVAVIIALRQTRLAYGKVIKIDCTSIVLRRGKNSVDMGFSISLSNVGLRKLSFSDWGVCIYKQNFQIEADLNAVLETEETKKLFCSIQDIMKFTSAFRGITKSKRNYKIIFFVRDYTGRKYKIYSGRRLADIDNDETNLHDPLAE